MPFPFWRSAARFEPSSAVVLIVIGLAGFLVDLLLKPVSYAGLALLLLAGTPSLVALFRRAQPAELATATAAKAAVPAIPAERASLPRAAAPAPAKGSPTRPAQPDQARAAVPAREHRQPEAEPARLRAEAQIGSVRRPAEPARIHPNTL